MFALHNYVELELNDEMILLLKVPFFNAKSFRKTMKNDTFLHTPNKIKFSTLMANFTFMFLEIKVY